MTKITACIILVIMAATWGAISYRLLELQPVSTGFMTIAGTLISIVTGGGIGDFLAQKFQVKNDHP